jgi:hypothetical protein
MPYPSQYVPATREADPDCNPAVAWRPVAYWRLWDLMHKLRADVFFKAYEQASTFHQMLKTIPTNEDLTLLSRDVLELIERLTVLAEELTALGMMGAAATITRGLDSLKAAPEVQHGERAARRIDVGDRHRIQTALSQGTSRVPDDLVGQVLLAIDPAKVHLYNQSAIFGDEVFNAFGLANEDISEAGTCLALERGTASVFHLMRALEVAVQVIANKLGATIHDGNGKGLPWGVIAENMKPLIDRMPQGSHEQIKWYRVQTHLVAVNRAWRVPTAHPKQTYTPEEAQAVFDATKSFMQELASLA